MTDTDESLRQDVKQEAPNELVGGDGHRSHLVAASVIPPAKRNVVAIESNEPVVGDGDAVSVAAEVSDDLLRPAEGGLGIDDPILTKQRSQESGEVVSARPGAGSIRHRSAGSCDRACRSPSTNFPRNTLLRASNGQEERVSRVNPAFPVRRDSTTRNHAVNVGMKQQVLSPRVKNAEETNLRSEMLGIACNFAECFGDGAEQQVVEFGLILQDERVKFVRQREDDVEVTGIEQFLLAGVDPSPPRLSLTLVAMTITTAVVGDGRISATLRTNIDMTAERCRAAARHGPNHLELAGSPR